MRLQSNSDRHIRPPRAGLVVPAEVDPGDAAVNATTPPRQQPGTRRQRLMAMLRLDAEERLFCASLLLMGALFRSQVVASPLEIKAFLADLACAILLTALGHLVQPRRRPLVFVGAAAAFAILLVADSVYYRSHSSVLSLFLLPQTEFLMSVSDSCLSLLRWFDLSYPAIALGLAGVLWHARRKVELPPTMAWRQRLHRSGGNAAMALVILGLLAASLTNVEASRLHKHWNRPFLIERFGAYTYHVSDIVKYISATSVFDEITDAELDQVTTFVRQHRASTRATNAYTGALKGQNLVMIHAESVQSLMMYRQVQGREVTPHLNRLASEGLFFENFHAQQSAGTSSDSEFTLNTSLFPIRNGTVFISHFDHTFVSMPGELRGQGYATLSLHGNDGSFWNRQIMHRTLGYDRFYSKADFTIDEEIGMGLSDMSFFRQSADILAQTPAPFYATLITLTNHTPFESVEHYGPFEVGPLEGLKTGNYIKSLHYADRALGQLFEDLERRGMLDDTTIVVYGDHPAGLPEEEIELLLERDLDTWQHKRARAVPFIVWSRRLKTPQRISRPMGMIDVYPTLANMLGLEAPFALGRDFFSSPGHAVIFPNGDWLDENVYFNASTLRIHVHNEEFAHATAREAGCGDPEACAAAEAIPREAPEGTTEELSWVFAYDPGVRPDSPLAGHLYDYVHPRNQYANESLEVSGHILHHDLLSPRGHRQELVQLGATGLQLAR